MPLHEAVAYLEQLQQDDTDEEDSPNKGCSIYIQPPGSDYDSAADDADEREGGLISDLHFNQFNANCEVNINLPKNATEGQEEDEERAMAVDMNDVQKDHRSISAKAPTTPWNYMGKEILVCEKSSCPNTKTKYKYCNKKSKLNARLGLFPEADHTDCAVPPHVLFERFFDNELLQMIVDRSNAYAVFQSSTNPQITVKELLVFIGILIISGYNEVADREDYWSVGGDMHNPMISKAMTRDRFRTISRFIHFTTIDDENRHDKMWKLRPLTERLVNNFVKNFKAEQHLSYDESMIAYYGPHSCKQFIRGKPIRYGYKVWSLNTPMGYQVSFEIYQGNNPFIHQKLGLNYGKCVAPLLQMIENFPEELRDLPFCFYFDNLFTNMAMLDYLKSKGYHGTGTCRKNFLPNNLPLSDKKQMKKQQRGHFEGVIIKDYDIAITTWHDNSTVTVASTLYDAFPVGKCSRFSLEEKRRIEVPRPNAVEQYNRYMGGVDRMDQNVGFYRIGKTTTNIKITMSKLFIYFFRNSQK